ncbi:MAG TPA: hypothetical protein VHE59_20975 [Mucilaginibacter sp.]|nr:hypothetical protein [Mucilaginibacter sp.]
MLIPSDEIPQADVLTDVVRTVISVSQGATTFQAIAASINKVERQGRYYRKAAEILELIATPARNHSVVTNLGNRFLQSGPTLTNPILLNAILNARVFQRIIPFLELNSQNGVTREEIVAFIMSIADLAANSMAPRRFNSVVSWLEVMQIIQRTGDRFRLSSNTINQAVEQLSFTDVDEPIMPRSTDLHEYRTVELRSSQAEETIITYSNLAATERADNAHRRLVNLVAERIRRTGSIPRNNQIIDLATRFNDVDFIFEMKSITNNNAKSQVRSALSQLYEYKYLQNLPDSNLVLVVENRLPPNAEWMVEYLETDRNIHVIWDGDDQLHGTERAVNTLGFLGLQ